VAEVYRPNRIDGHTLRSNHIRFMIACEAKERPKVGECTLPVMMDRGNPCMITGGGMEYVVAEARRRPAHVIMNAPIPYALSGDRFYFADQENHRHEARIALQTLIDPNAIMTVPSTTWRSAAGPGRYYVKRSANSLYAELILDGKDQGTVEYEAKWDGRQCIGLMHWNDGNVHSVPRSILPPPTNGSRGSICFP
jgi:hypothetical protein